MPINDYYLLLPFPLEQQFRQDSWNMGCVSSAPSENQCNLAWSFAPIQNPVQILGIHLDVSGSGCTFNLATLVTFYVTYKYIYEEHVDLLYIRPKVRPSRMRYQAVFNAIFQLMLWVTIWTQLTIKWGSVWRQAKEMEAIIQLRSTLHRQQRRTAQFLVLAAFILVNELSGSAARGSHTIRFLIP